ncbi:MAG TPA: hypothetical protein VIJ75_23175, partial [Hanamia sp.]
SQLIGTQHATGLMVKVAPLLPSRDLLSSHWQLRWTHTKGLKGGGDTKPINWENTYLPANITYWFSDKYKI